MTKEGYRKHRPYVEFTPNNLVRGEFPCPFTSTELKLLENLRDGFDGRASDSEKVGMNAKMYKNLRGSIGEKIRGIYYGSGEDQMAKALSISVLGGWIDSEQFEEKKIELSSMEFLLLFQRCFGNTPKQIIREMHLKPEQFSEMFLGIEKKLQLGEYQVIAWGASKAKQWIRENPDQAVPFFR